MERSIRYNFFVDLETLQHKLSSDYSLNICFSRRFARTDGPSFSPYKPLQNVHFSEVGNTQFFFQEMCSHIDKNSEKKFEFLVKIASKGLSLSICAKSGHYAKAEGLCGNTLFYCLTKISVQAKHSISNLISLFIIPSPFLVH